MPRQRQARNAQQRVRENRATGTIRSYGAAKNPMRGSIGNTRMGGGFDIEIQAKGAGGNG